MLDCSVIPRSALRRCLHGPPSTLRTPFSVLRSPPSPDAFTASRATKTRRSIQKNRTSSPAGASGKGFGFACVSLGSGSVFVQRRGFMRDRTVGRSDAKVKERRRWRAGSTLARGPIAGPATPAGVHIRGSRHAQQRGAAPRPVGADTPSHASDRARPFESIMLRCGLLGLRFVHRTKTPTSRNAARTAGPRSTFPWAGRDPHPPRRWPSWLREAEPSRFRGRVESRLAVDPARAGARP
jgi:hypothetical protein